MNYDITALPSVKLCDRKFLPDAPGVYIASERANYRYLYVGMSEVNLRTRWIGHEVIKKIDNDKPKINHDDVSIYYITGLPVNFLPTLEDALIVYLCPWFNNPHRRSADPEIVRLARELDMASAVMNSRDVFGDDA